MRATQPSAQAVQLRLLGEPAWSAAGNETVRLTAKDAALLALLALDGTKSRNALCATLWPDADEHQAAANLRQRLSRLRRAAGAELVQSGDALRLAPHVVVDVLTLANQSAEELLATGDLLAGMEFGELEDLDRWLADARAKVLGWRAQALADHAEKLMLGGQLRDALPLSQRIVELTPLAEHAWRRLMRVHYLRGDRAAALAAFEKLSARLLDEWGIQPSPETLQLWQTIESAVPARPLPQQPVPASVMLPPVMVGRAEAWHAMAQAWQQGRPFVLIGEAGLGKSRLLQEFLAGRQALAQDKARPGDEHIPYALLGRVLLWIDQHYAPLLSEVSRRELARIRPEFGLPWPAMARAELLHQALEEYLVAALAAGLHGLALDDLHDADTATLEALRWLAQSPRLATLKLALATRPPHTPALQQLLREWFNDSQPPARVALEPLSQADLAVLLASLALPNLVDPAVTSHLFRHAGGHPLYTLATLQDALSHGRDLRQHRLPDPPSVRALLDTRLRELPSSTQGLLQVAAIAGADLNAERAAAMMGCRPLELAEPWRLLEAANVLRGEGFTHDLVYEAALRSVPAGLRVALHRQFGELLSAEPLAAPGRVAWHWEQGQRWAEAGRCWHAAGLAARGAGRLAEQVELLEQAARCHELAGDLGASFESLVARLDGLQLRHGGTAVLSALPAVEALADTGLRRLRCRLARAEAWLDDEHSDKASAEATQAVQEAQQHLTLRADAQALLAMALAQQQQHDAALQAAQAALTSATAADNPAQRLRATNALAYVLYGSGSLGDAVPVQRSAVVLAEALGDRAAAAAAEGHVAALLASVGDAPGTHAHALRAQQRQSAVGLAQNSTVGTVNHLMLGAAAAYLGQFGDALESLQAALAMAGGDAAVAMQAKTRLALGNLWLTLGRPAQARELMSTLPAGMVPGMQMQAALLLARAAAMEGLPEQRHWQALALLGQQHPDLPLVQSAWYELSFQGEAALITRQLQKVSAECRALGLHGTARSLQLRELARRLELSGASSAATTLLLAQELAPHVALGMSAKVYPPQAWLVLASAFERAGKHPESADLWALGRQWIAQAMRQVPAEYRHSFESVNPSNRLLLGQQPLGG